MPQTFAWLAVLTLALAVAPTAGASHNGSSTCQVEGKNTQCNDLGYIAMDNQREIRGDPITLTVDATLMDNYIDQGARYIMFSIRHDAGGFDSPVSLSLKSFQTARGAIFTERIDHDVPNEINIWAHVSDIPEGEPIDIVIDVGASQRGAFRVETLVMPFDRGYEPLVGPDGEDITLFSFTMLGVNKETKDVGGAGGSFVERVRTPGLGMVGILAAVGAAMVVARGRKE